VWAAIFPGDRRVWRWSLVAIVPMAGLIAYFLVVPRSYYTGTNSVGVRSIVASVKQGQRLCVPDLLLPGRTAAVQFSYGVLGPPPALRVTISSGGRVVARGSARGQPPGPPAHVTVPIAPQIPARPVVRHATLCIAVGRGGSAQVAGFAALPSNLPPPTIDGRPLKAGIALWFLPTASSKRSLIQQWPTIMRRLTLFRPGFAGKAFYWALFLVGLPLLVYLGVRMLAVAEAPRRRLGLMLAIVGFLSAATWAITTVAFDTPDESEHFAYTESLAERGQALAPNPTVRPPYASDEIFALDAVHHFSYIEVGDTRPPWFPQDQKAWQRRVTLQRPARDNGGGFAVATDVHSPLYYAVLVPGYEAGRGGGIFTELFWMRLISALMGAVVVAAAFATIRELIPTRPELAAAGALLIAFQPMFSFIAGGVDNDNGVNAMAALAVYLTVRMLRRGLTWKTGAALGLTVAALPLMKGTGLALYPAIGLAVLWTVVSRRSRPVFAGLGAMLASFASLAVVWALTAASFHRPVLPVPSGTGLGGGQIGGKLAYIWEAFLPRLPFMAPHFASGEWPFSFIYIHRGFGAFGWYAIFFPNWVYHVLIVVLGLVVLLTLAALARRHRLVLERWPETVFLALVIFAVFVGVELAYYSATPRPVFLTPEQGRYAFTAAVPIASFVVAGLLALSRRSARALCAVLVSAMACLWVVSHLLYIAHDFT
jgi:hypothetical protein